MDAEKAVLSALGINPRMFGMTVGVATGPERRGSSAKSTMARSRGPSRRRRLLIAGNRFPVGPTRWQSQSMVPAGTTHSHGWPVTWAIKSKSAS
jgi:hypothetical protein